MEIFWSVITLMCVCMHVYFRTLCAAVARAVTVALCLCASLLSSNTLFSIFIRFHIFIFIIVQVHWSILIRAAFTFQENARCEMYDPCPAVAVADWYGSFRMPPIQWIVLIWYTMPLIIMPLLYNIQNRKNFETHIIEWLWWSSFETCMSACVRVCVCARLYVNVFVNLMHCGNKIRNRECAI